MIVGIGDGFVKAVLDTKAGDSLADQAAYQRAIGLAGASNAGQGFVNLTASEPASRRSRRPRIEPPTMPTSSRTSSRSRAWPGRRGLGSDLTTARIVLVLK